MCRKGGALYKNTAALRRRYCLTYSVVSAHRQKTATRALPLSLTPETNSTGRQAFQPAALFYKWGKEKEIYLPLRFLLTTHAPPVRDSSAMPAYRAMPASKVLGELMGLVVLGLVVGLEEATV